MTKWFRQNLLLLTGAGALLLLATAYVSVVSLLIVMYRQVDWQQAILHRFGELLIIVWLLWFGGAIGSFLNVVVFRLPAGRSLQGFSACPYCQTRIAGRHNIPVFGWLILRGRCAACKLPIASRYPIVELGVGVSLAVYAYLTLAIDGGNLPFVASKRGFELWQVPLRVTHESIALVCYHSLALASSWAIGLILFGGSPLPRGLTIFVLLMIPLPMLIWPLFQVVPWGATLPEGWYPTDRLDAFMRILTGAMAAMIVARGLGQTLLRDADIKLNPLGKATQQLLDLAVALAIPGVIVGWQSLPAVVLMSSLLAIVTERWFVGRSGVSRIALFLPVSLFLQLTFWSLTDSSVYFPGTAMRPEGLIAAYLAILVIVLWLKPRATENA